MVFGQFLTPCRWIDTFFDHTADSRKVAKMKLVDAIHLATAIRTRCRYFVTRDGDFLRMLGGTTKIVPDATAIADLVTRSGHDRRPSSRSGSRRRFPPGRVETMAVEGATFDIAKARPWR